MAFWGLFYTVVALFLLVISQSRISMIFCILLIATVVFGVWFNCAAFKKNHYEIVDGEIIIKYFAGKSKRHPIDKIFKIEYIDVGTEWMRFSPSGRYQLAAYFDRQYFKSVEPRRFGPEDRDAFVAALLEIKPDIEVIREEKRVKVNAYPCA